MASSLLINEINTVLNENPKYWDGQKLLKNKVIDDLKSYDESLISLLLENPIVKKQMTFMIKDETIFKIDELISILRFKSYWDDSYTKFTNEIGLSSENRFLKYNSDIVLDFPHKDCFLEGAMRSEDLGKDEVYYHEILAKEEIDTLLSPKVLSNIKKFENNHEDDNVVHFNSTDNLIIKGNNLIALYSLQEQFKGKIKLIYIDPPYNTGEDSFKYNDQFNHSTWLTFMKNRLEIAIKLLRNDGSIWINIDDGEVHYLKVLMDEIVGRNNFVANIVWQKRTSPDSRLPLGTAHDNILVFAKNQEAFKKTINKISLSGKRLSEFKNPDNDPNGPWVSVDMTGQVGHATASQFYTITSPIGKEFKPPSNRCWAISEVEYLKLHSENRIWFGKNGDARPRFKKYLHEAEGSTVWTWWSNAEVGHNQEAKKESINLLENSQDAPFSTPKPERLLKRIIEVASSPDDIVMDFFMGSGTTQAVSMKMGRQFIGIEQMDYINTVTIPRLQKVISGEQGGISKEVEWSGGGSFVYMELHELNNHFLKELIAASDTHQLKNMIKQITKSGHLNFKADIEKLNNLNNEFSNQSLEDQKNILIKVLDMNQLYLSYSEIDDSQYSIPLQVKKFNNSFYKKMER